MAGETSAETPARADLERCFRQKYSPWDRVGWGPRLRARFGYFTPDDWYEATVDKLVTPQTAWLDVGCGRFLLPSNDTLARTLAGRCRLLVGVDPDRTLEENEYVHEKIRAPIEEVRTEHKFDLISLRMVVEHVQDPDSCVRSLARLTGPGGRVVVYTVFRWSPVPLLTGLVPFRLHHPIKKLLWGTESKDTFPVANLMNTHRALRRIFEAHGFREEAFHYLDDCRTTGQIRVLQWVEIATWRALRVLGLHYPEVCLLGVYRM